MAIRVGINGFGRIGRYVVRAGIKRDDIEFVGINDLFSPEQLAFNLKYDSAHGRFDADVQADETSITINGKRIPVSAERDVAKLGWKDLGAEMVFECTGLFLQRDAAAKHLDAGAKWVLLSAPGKEEDLTVAYGVNHEQLDLAKHHVISNASCTTNCLAPLAKAIDDAFGIEHGLMTTIHSYTASQALLDGPHRKDARRGRAAALSMIPTTTGAAKAVGKVLPNLNGKLDGMSVRVPTPNVSLTDLTANVRKSATPDEVRAAVKAASEGSLKGVLEYNDEPIVSIDCMGNPHSSIFIPDQTRTMGNLIKVLSWYDNEAGFSNRMLDVAGYIASKR